MKIRGKDMDVELILKVAGEQTKTVNNRFWCSECAETRSNGSEACLTSRTTMFQEERERAGKKYGC
jgi:hypothetical protein